MKSHLLNKCFREFILEKLQVCYSFIPLIEQIVLKERKTKVGEAIGVIVYKQHRKICQIFFRKTSCHLKYKSRMPRGVLAKLFSGKNTKLQFFKFNRKHR